MSRFHATKHLPFILAALALFVGPGWATAAVPTTGYDWQYAVSLDFFAPAVEGSTAAGSDSDVSFETLISNLDRTFMGAFEACKGKWSALADLLYLKVGANGGAQAPLAYRYLKWNLGSGSAIDDINFSGPQLTATLRL